MMDYDEVLCLLRERPFPWERLKDLIFQGNPGKEELMALAVKAAESFEFTEEPVSDEEAEKNLPRDLACLEEVQQHPLLLFLKLLLECGFDPNTRIDGDLENVMIALKYVDKPFLAATCLRELLEHGADPNLETEYGGFFEDIDADICADINLLPDRIPLHWFHLWLVLIGFGGRPEKAAPFTLKEGHSYSELKCFEYFDYYLRYDPEKKENIMHIIDTRTNEEIGLL